jgi:two-component system, chemotaxis family, chemotaxis protein CheY
MTEEKEKILIVDDSLTMRKLINLALEFNKYQVTQATDGVDALEKLKSGSFDLFVVDILMPKMNGLLLIQSIREMEQYTKTPILVMSTEGDEISRIHGMKAGATAYLAKPFQPSQFLAKVEEVLHLG